MGVGAAFTVFVLFIASVDAGGGVQFWRKNITMTCPEEATAWNLNGKPTDAQEKIEKTYTLQYDNGKKGPHFCSYKDGTGGDKKYYFYVQGKVCEKCFELDGNAFLVAIVADILFTVGVMFVIYNCTKKKSSGESSLASNAPALPGGRAPPIPHPDYEALNPHTQNKDTYSHLR
ncbi:T-cell surface glycoprotein CD3 epsilon chain-like [Halichoeres trimaculatus]|uniref:T-cell surface glycoprotein CD3 epsilon chain-like n=1 Tax=Halichoeres trimaculatus TaxID=147232 RepID=UPI003D9DD7D6